MLILTRRIGETLWISGDTEVAVLGVKGNQVRIGIAAPKDVNIVREELLDERTPDPSEDDARKKAATG